MNEHYNITKQDDHTRIAFLAMASPCEILLRSIDEGFCHDIAKLTVTETQRIEQKYSRYSRDNLVYQMNSSNGNSIDIDQETFQLLEYAKSLFDLSDGMFDITSGVLRKIWSFSKNSKPPSQKQISRLIKNIGFSQLGYDRASFIMRKNMEIDFGGIGKEYAVDQVGHLIRDLCQSSKCSFLINFGGDIVADCFSSSDPKWIVGIEPISTNDKERTVIKIRQGAVATSGNSKRFFDYQGRRYGHLLNPKTGYPIENSPLSVTTFAKNCVLAGSFSSLAMLQGLEAEELLEEQGIRYICRRA